MLAGPFPRPSPRGGVLGVSKKAKVLLVVAGAAALLVAVAAFVKSVAEWSELRRTEAELAKVRSQARAVGVPIEPSDLRRNPPVAESDNAAPAIAEVAKLTCKDGLLEQPVKLLLHADAGAPDGPNAKSWTMMEPLLESMRYASAKPHCDFDYRWETGATPVQPEMDAAKDFARLLAKRAAASAKAGRLEEALGDLRAAQNVGRLIAETPGLRPFAVCGRTHEIAMWGFAQTMSECADQPAALKRMRSELDRLPAPKPDIMNVARGMAVMDVAIARSIGQSGFRGGEGFPELPTSPAARKRLSKALECRVLKYWIQAWSVAEGQPVDRALADKLDGVRDAVDALPGLDDRFADKLPIGLGPMVMVAARMDARLRIARAVADVFVFRSERGRLPKDLAEAGSHEVDPFDGRPLRYRVEGQGFVVYSVGEDGTDDGGTLSMGIQGPRKLDLGWAWTPEQRGGVR